MNEKTEKVKYVCDVPCPHCKTIVVIKKKIKIKVPAQKAEKEETYFAEQGVQLTLDSPKDEEA
jgi:hypothetical protein